MADEKGTPRTRPARSGALVAALAATLVLAGCAASQPGHVPPGETGATSRALRDHQARQRARAEEGGYKRLYRQKNCRDPRVQCDGYGHFARP